jgi:hypothetical protein
MRGEGDMQSKKKVLVASVPVKTPVPLPILPFAPFE